MECNLNYKTKRLRPCKDGQFRCKPCSNKIRQDRYASSEKGKQVIKLKTQRDSKKNIERATKWAKENPERRKEIAKKYSTSDKGKAANIRRSRKHYWADPEYQRQKAIARMHGVTPKFIQELNKEQPNCQLCGGKEKLTVDHMHPVSRGGKAVKDNIQALCASCNSWKQDKIFLAGNSGYLVEVA